MIKSKLPLILALALALPRLCVAAESLTITVANPLALDRKHETLELSASALAPLGVKDLERIHVRNAAGQEVLCQAVESAPNDYHVRDAVIFQADFAPGETQTFTVSAGPKHQFALADFKAYGRFVRERFDDFAWENDRIAHRMYGRALETWKGEPLTSSAVDVWSKRVPRLVIDEWYLVDNYHTDLGTGCDDYSAGMTRGCGGSGLWAADKLWVSRNFTDSRTLANGPIRVMFDLIYEPFDVNGVSVAEVKRISLDAGQNLDHFQSFFQPYSRPEKPAALTAAAGLRKMAGEQKEFNAARGTLTVWMPMEKNLGMLGCALIADPKLLVKPAEDKLNNLLLLKTDDSNAAAYWAGFTWDRAGQITTQDNWKKYVDEFAQGLQSPIKVSVSAK